MKKKLSVVQSCVCVLVLLLMLVCPLGKGVSSGGKYTDLNLGVTVNQKADSRIIYFSDVYEHNGPISILFVLVAAGSVLLNLVNIKKYDNRGSSKAIRLVLSIIMVISALFLLNAGTDVAVPVTYRVTASVWKTVIMALSVGNVILDITEIMLRPNEAEN